jgi:hypothetical protein
MSIFDSQNLNESEMTALRCAFADLIGAVQAYKQGDYTAHDWKAHIQTIEEMKAAFPFLDDIPEDIYNEEE